MAHNLVCLVTIFLITRCLSFDKNYTVLKSPPAEYSGFWKQRWMVWINQDVGLDIKSSNKFATSSPTSGQQWTFTTFNGGINGRDRLIIKPYFLGGYLWNISGTQIGGITQGDMLKDKLHKFIATNTESIGYRLLDKYPQNRRQFYFVH